MQGWDLFRRAIVFVASSEQGKRNRSRRDRENTLTGGGTGRKQQQVIKRYRETISGGFTLFADFVCIS